MTNLQQLLHSFKSNCVEFIDELIALFPAEVDFIMMRHVVKDTIPPDTILNQIIKDILPHKQNIANRDGDFFLLLADSGMPQAYSNKIRILWRSAILDDQDRRAIWEWMDTFVKFAETYQKLKIQA